MLDTNVTPSAVIDGEFDSESCIEQVCGYNDVSVCHLIFSNHTWVNTDITKLTEFYQSQSTLLKKVEKMQDNCDMDLFMNMLRKYGLRYIPVYSKAIDISTISTDSTARVYHDPKEYLENGSPTTEELTSFVQLVMRQCLEPLFSHKEIAAVLKVKLNLFDDLIEATSKNEAIADIQSVRTIDSEVTNWMKELLKMQDVCDLKKQIDQSVTRFLVTFALHSIRTHFKCSFGVDGELKFYNREMYSKAIADLSAAKKSMAPKNLMSEKMVKSEKKSFGSVKVEKGSRSEEVEDADYCEIVDIDSPPVQKKKTRMGTLPEPQSKPTTKSTPSSEVPGPSALVSTEIEVMERMQNSPELEDWVKWGLRGIIDSNRRLRNEIKEVRMMISLKVEEQKRKLKS